MIRYFIERLPGGRAQAYADWIDPTTGEVFATTACGSPAPREAVEAMFGGRS